MATEGLEQAAVHTKIPTPASTWASKQDQHQSFQKEIDDYLKKQDEFVKEIAEKYGKKPIAIQSLLARASSFKPTRAPSLHNAKVHAKSLELNEGSTC